MASREQLNQMSREQLEAEAAERRIQNTKALDDNQLRDAIHIYDKL